MSRQWQCNDLYLTSIFILNPKGERNWYYWVTDYTQPLSCNAYTILKAILQDSAIVLILGEETFWKVSNLPRSYNWEGCAQARMCLCCHAEAFSILRPKGRTGYPRGSPTALVWIPTWDRQHSSSRHIHPPRTGMHKDCRLIHAPDIPFIITVLSQFI